MLFFKPSDARKRGDKVAVIGRRAKEESFYLEREKALQVDLKTTAEAVTRLRKEVEAWYTGDGKDLISSPFHVKYPVNPDK